MKNQPIIFFKRMHQYKLRDQVKKRATAGNAVLETENDSAPGVMIVITLAISMIFFSNSKYFLMSP